MKLDVLSSLQLDILSKRFEIVNFKKTSYKLGRTKKQTEQKRLEEFFKPFFIKYDYYSTINWLLSGPVEIIENGTFVLFVMKSI